MHDYWFGEALGELRSGAGMQVAIIAASFGLDVEDDLARTLPEPEHDWLSGRRRTRRPAVQGAMLTDEVTHVVNIYNSAQSGFEEIQALDALQRIADRLGPTQRHHAAEAIETKKADPRGRCANKIGPVPLLTDQTLEAMRASAAWQPLDFRDAARALAESIRQAWATVSGIIGELNDTPRALQHNGNGAGVFHGKWILFTKRV